MTAPEKPGLSNEEFIKEAEMAYKLSSEHSCMQYFKEAIMRMEALIGQGQEERDYTPEEALIEANKRWGGKNAVSVECYLSQWDDIDYDKIPKVGKKYKVSGIYKNQEFEGSSFREAFLSADKAEADRER